MTSTGSFTTSFGSPSSFRKARCCARRVGTNNSADNPANPDPTTPVRFGEQTFEEMMIGYFDSYDPHPLSEAVNQP